MRQAILGLAALLAASIPARADIRLEPPPTPPPPSSPPSPPPPSAMPTHPRVGPQHRAPAALPIDGASPIDALRSARLALVDDQAYQAEAILRQVLTRLIKEQPNNAALDSIIDAIKDVHDRTRCVRLIDTAIARVSQ